MIHNIRPPSVILTDRCLACMNAVSKCFPFSVSLLCLWHANKAVVTHCRPAFIPHKSKKNQSNQDLEGCKKFEDHWHSIIQSSSEDEFNQRVQKFEDAYLPQYHQEVGYIKDQWLGKYKEKIVNNWVNQHRHFGNVVTSRIENIHSLLKQYIPSAELDLFQVWVFLNKAVVNQLRELQANQFQQQTRLAVDLGNSLYSVVNGWVSCQALRSVENQRLRLNDKNLPDCTYTFTPTMGLPCAHVLKSLREQDKVLQLSHFHTHWPLMRSGSPLSLLEPRRLTDPITARSTISNSNTRREPSEFEAVEAATEPRA